MVLSGQTYRYRLWKWIPFHRKDYGNFGQLPLAEKAVSLNQKLLKHIGQDLARYLNLEITGLQAGIIQILKTHTRPVFYEGNPYYGFDIEFKSEHAVAPVYHTGEHQIVGIRPHRTGLAFVSTVSGQANFAGIVL